MAHILIAPAGFSRMSHCTDMMKILSPAPALCLDASVYVCKCVLNSKCACSPDSAR